jgi:restriction system protein
MSHIRVTSKHKDAVKTGRLEAVYSVDRSRVLRYTIDFRHKELDLHRTLSAPEIFMLQNKVDALISQWDKKHDELIRRSQLASEKHFAEQATVDAQAALDAIHTILPNGLKRCAAIDWEEIKDQSSFGKQLYTPPPPPAWQKNPEPVEIPPEISIWDKLFGKAARKRDEAKAAHERALQQWRASMLQKSADHSRGLDDWKISTVQAEAEFRREEKQYYDEQASDNAKIDALAAAVAVGDPKAIIEHATLVLDRSDYGDLFEKAFDLEYLPDERTLLVEYRLPSPDAMPKLKAVKFVKASGELKPTYISDREQLSNFDSACYQTCLRTLYELFNADICGNLSKVLFNGITEYVDKATGKDVISCIMSVLVDRDQFSQLDLARIDPKACFKSLKGVSASQLSALAPIAPVLQLNKSDRRFIDARDAISQVDDSTNLAAMDWEDFEHLVRGVFEKEFAARGGEVRITQSSSDGGVDAVAFDPDPITGGKIVIQAKRYTKTVGVSAVRDLYGTMQHESASRGILVTTADFGPDAHRFSAGKPITLMTGANLLHLLTKHGINAKIDLREARMALNLR